MSRSGQEKREVDPSRQIERWSYEHPTFGLIEVFVGTREQIRDIDSGFPALSVNYWAKDPTSLLVRQQGVVIARCGDLSKRKIELTRTPEALADDELDYSAVFTKSYVKIQPGGLLDSWVRSVQIQVDGSPILLDAPPGSKGAERQRAMEKSPFKRWAYPLASGMGKGFWALFCLVILPLIGDIFDPVVRWLLQFIPDWDIPWPDINLPRIPWPEINWPDINLPRIPWPDITAPGWVIFLIDYSKVWIPVLIGLVIGIQAVRAAKNTREEKLKAKRRDVAGLLHARMRQLQSGRDYDGGERWRRAR